MGGLGVCWELWVGILFAESMSLHSRQKNNICVTISNEEKCLLYFSSFGVIPYSLNKSPRRVFGYNS